MEIINIDRIIEEKAIEKQCTSITMLIQDFIDVSACEYIAFSKCTDLETLCDNISQYILYHCDINPYETLFTLNINDDDKSLLICLDIKTHIQIKVHNPELTISLSEHKEDIVNKIKEKLKNEESTKRSITDILDEVYQSFEMEENNDNIEKKRKINA